MSYRIGSWSVPLKHRRKPGSRIRRKMPDDRPHLWRHSCPLPRTMITSNRYRSWIKYQVCSLLCTDQSNWSEPTSKIWPKVRLSFQCIKLIFLPLSTAPPASNKPLKSALKKTPSIKKQELEPLFKAREYGEFVVEMADCLLIVDKVIQKHTIRRTTLIKGGEVRFLLTICSWHSFFPLQNL
jgi:hypothetical protein